MPKSKELEELREGSVAEIVDPLPQPEVNPQAVEFEGNPPQPGEQTAYKSRISGIRYTFQAPSARDYRRYVPSELQRGNRQGEFAVDVALMDPLLEIYVSPKPNFDKIGVAELAELELQFYLFLMGARRREEDQG